MGGKQALNAAGVVSWGGIRRGVVSRVEAQLEWSMLRKLHPIFGVIMPPQLTSPCQFGSTKFT